MEIIVHRRNTAALLAETPIEFGIEIDVRSRGRRLILSHDAYTDGEDLERWLDYYHHGRIILNVKEEGLEERLLALMADRQIEEFFFLDQSFPFLLRTLQAGETRCAVRVSEYESVNTALTLAGMARWAWVDCFTDTPFDPDGAHALVNSGYDLCLVSPELQGRNPDVEITRIRRHFAENSIPVAAVCTKVPHLWS